MSKIYRFTGPPENWITGIGLRKWAVNEHNRGLWEKLEPGDTALLHSAARSAYGRQVPSAIIGYAVIASKTWIKDQLWWMQEKTSGSNLWPYVFTLDELYLFNDNLEVNFLQDNLEKPPAQLGAEVEALAASGITLKTLNAQAASLNADVPAFPVNGSASTVNRVYEQLIIQAENDYYPYTSPQNTDGITTRLAEAADETLATQSLESVRAAATTYQQTGSGYTEKAGTIRIRKDNELQKRRIAFLENRTCQVCGFYCEYLKSNGATGWIIDVDHIIDKHKGGGETMGNLWVLCPNCHRKKTHGVIVIDPATQTISESGTKISIRDAHLGWSKD